MSAVAPPCGAPCHILERALVELATHHGTTLAVERARMGLTPPPGPQDGPRTASQPQTARTDARPVSTPPGGHQ